MKPEIVRASADMIPEILCIEQSSFENAWTEKMLRDELTCEHASFTCAFLSGTLCGFLVAHKVLDECEIYDLAVAPEYRRRGMASALLSDAIQSDREIARVFLEVRSRNLPAVALYENFGFKRTGLRRGYYENPKDDAILMTYIPEE